MARATATRLTKTTTPALMQCAVHVPVHPFLVDSSIFPPNDKHEFPRNSPVEGISFNRHASDPEVIRIGRGPLSGDSDGDLEGALHHP